MNWEWRTNGHKDHDTEFLIHTDSVDGDFTVYLQDHASDGQYVSVHVKPEVMAALARWILFVVECEGFPQETSKKDA